ncbi:MAG: hypothetical protein ACE5FU_02540 [Nitrospinota bacterium]
MIKSVAILVLFAFFAVSGSFSHAEAQSDVEVVLKDSFYGGLLGTLVAGGILLTKDKPGDNLNYLSTGAGIGILGGAVYGLVTLSRGSILEISGGNLSLHLPDIQVHEIVETKKKIYSAVSADLLSYRF